MRQRELKGWIERGDHAALRRVAEDKPLALLRKLVALTTGADARSLPAVLEAAGQLSADPELLPEERAREFLRGLFWLLSDESGAVPMGVPRLAGEVLARRPELQDAFLPLLAALIHQPDLLQSGPLLRDAVMGLGRVGAAVAGRCPDCLEPLRQLAGEATDAELREAAVQALERIQAR